MTRKVGAELQSLPPWPVVQRLGPFLVREIKERAEDIQEASAQCTYSPENPSGRQILIVSTFIDINWWISFFFEKKKNVVRIEETPENSQNVFNLVIRVGVVPKTRKSGCTMKKKKRPPDKMENWTISLPLW